MRKKISITVLFLCMLVACGGAAMITLLAIDVANGMYRKMELSPWFGCSVNGIVLTLLVCFTLLGIVACWLFYEATMSWFRKPKVELSNVQVMYYGDEKLLVDGSEIITHL